jgi:pyruvate,water dikinase
VLHDGDAVTVSCAQGERGHIYEGLLEYEINQIDLGNITPTATKLTMNVGNPDIAFKVAKLPNDGVGLARMEFIITHYINAHPMALVELSQGKVIQDTVAVKAAMIGYDDPKAFFIDKLSEGIGMIAAAFYPRSVIVRTSDFKSNEYRHMSGGKAYEQVEENPMIGFRGASRYYSPEYKEAFLWECEALKRVRDDMGLNNVKVMLPFVRTPDEGRKAIAVMNSAGLVQGENTLEVYAMCEIPSNVILADLFLEIFDGYSIGSNDLTQLILGVDRDSSLVSSVFDERNEAVKRMIGMAIRACKERGKYIGICGQAPSDYPEITRFLVEEGIDSISLNPDSLLKMRQVVSQLEAKMEK